MHTLGEDFQYTNSRMWYKNVDKLIQVLIRLSYLAADYPEIVELDINPLLVFARS